MSGNKDDIWNHFKNDEEQGVAECNNCHARLKNTRKFNLKNHLKNVHNIHLNISNNENKNPNTSSLSSIVRKRKIKIEINKKQIFRAFIGLVTEDGVPFNVLNSQNMRAFTDPICDGLGVSTGKKFRLNADNCKKTLQLVARNIREDLTLEFNRRFLSLKIDSATRLTRNIFGISAQFIDKDCIVSRILGMVELKGMGSSSSRNLASEIVKTLTKFEINLSQIVSITSDNGANMLKATKILAHVCSFEENEYGEDDEEKNDVYLQKIQSFDSFPEIRVGDIQICRCVAHTAQLCALDVTKNCEIKKNLLQCRNLTKFCRKNTNGCRDVFAIKKFKIPQLDCPTRWGSTYNMLDDLKAAKSILINLEAIRNKSEEENFENNEMLWDFIESYCVVFNPMQRTILKFQEEQLHYGDFYAQWLKCRVCTEQIVQNEENTSSFIQTIGRSFLQAFEIRSKKLMENESMLATLFLDPRFQYTLDPKQKNCAIAYLKKLWDRIQSKNFRDAPIITPTCSSSNLQIEEFKDKEDAMLQEYLNRDRRYCTTSHDTVDVHNKIEMLQLPFLRIDGSVMDFWKHKIHSDPDLYSLYNICFAIPPTQVTIERAFSTLKIVLADNRNRLSDETLENILLVKLNSSFLDNAINSLSLFEEQEE